MTVNGTVAGVVRTSNVWLVDPLAIVTVAGTVTASLLLASVTTAPALGAAASSVTVPVTVRPLAMVLADKVTPLNPAAVGAVAVDEWQAAAAKANTTTTHVKIWRTADRPVQNLARGLSRRCHTRVTELA